MMTLHGNWSSTSGLSVAAGGTISGGTVDLGGGAVLTFGGSTNNRLVNLTVTGI